MVGNNIFDLGCFPVLGVLESFLEGVDREVMDVRTAWNKMGKNSSGAIASLLTAGRCALNLSARFLFVFFKRNGTTKQIKLNIFFCLGPLEEVTSSFYMIFITTPPPSTFYSLIEILTVLL